MSDGSGLHMVSVKERPIWNGTKAFGKWAKYDFAEWFIGSWALILGWGIVGIIFISFLQMDGHFSRGLGEGSGVDPGLFQHVGWMYRCFGALFLVLAVKLTVMGLKHYAIAVRVLGVVITLIVVLHATGFGLAALAGKSLNADAVVEETGAVQASRESVIKALNEQKASIREDLARQVAPLNEEVARLDTDGKRNEELATTQKNRRKDLEDAANAKISEIDALILERVMGAGDVAAKEVRDKITTQKFSPLFVGLAQLATLSEKPSDGTIFLAGVIFIVFWVIAGDAIAIVLPSALYEMHLKDAKTRHVRVTPEAFADLQAQADELARRKANLADGQGRAQTTKGKKKNRATTMALLEDKRAQAVKREEIQKVVDEEAALDQAGEFVEPEEAPEPAPEAEPEIEPTETPDVTEADNDEQDQPEEKAA